MASPLKWFLRVLLFHSFQPAFHDPQPVHKDRKVKQIGHKNDQETHYHDAGIDKDVIFGARFQQRTETDQDDRSPKQVEHQKRNAEDRNSGSRIEEKLRAVFLLGFAGKITAENKCPGYPKQVQTRDNETPDNVAMGTASWGGEMDQTIHIGNPDRQGDEAAG